VNGTIIAADVGGTSTRIAAVHDGTVAGEVVRFGTPSPRRDPALTPAQAATATLDRLATEVTVLWRRSGCPGRLVAVALGAVVDTAGVVRNASTLWLAPLTGLDIRAELSRRLPWATVVILNDISAAAWHYRAHGRFALVTVSTGIAIKVFDAGHADGLLLDPAGIGGEGGHTPADLGCLDSLPGGASSAGALGRAAAAGDAATRELLGKLGVPWCECGALADLCSFASGPATVRAAVRAARWAPAGFAASVLHSLAGGDAASVDASMIAAAARQGDPFTLTVIAAAVRPLAARLLSLAADLGLRKALVVGGFAHGVGEPWFAALRAALAGLAVDSGWFTGWQAGDFGSFLVVPDDDARCVLLGMAAYARHTGGAVRAAVKPVGAAELAIRTGPRPACGREQFLAEVVFAGICATDLQILRGERDCEPGVPGHECVARVAEVGPALAGELSVGDVIGLNANLPASDHGRLGHDVPGVFTSVFTGGRAMLERGQVIKLPAAGRSEWVLLEPLGGVVRAQRAVASLSGHGGLSGRTLLIAGAGMTAMLHAMLARAHGATVLVANRSAARLADAAARGLLTGGEVVPWGSGLAEAVLSRTGGRGADAAVVAVTGAGGPQVARWLWPALAPGAVVHLFGGFPAGSTLRLGNAQTADAGALRSAARHAQFISPCQRPVVLCGTRGGQHDDFAAARDAAAAPQPSLDLSTLISHVISLGALPAVAAELASHGTVGGTRAWRVVIDLSWQGERVTEVTGRPPTLADGATL
jgi:threonine dehydrogenase-like Zn-dependent dehydrogenase/predicted NBD/HSP70 family sugar kinase